MRWVWIGLATWLVASMLAAPIVGRLLRRVTQETTRAIDAHTTHAAVEPPSLTAHAREHEALLAIWERAAGARDDRAVAEAVCDALIAQGASGVALTTFHDDDATVLGIAGAPPWDVVTGRAARALADTLQQTAAFGPRVARGSQDHALTLTAPLGPPTQPAGLLALRITERDVDESEALATTIHVARLTMDVLVDDDLVIDLVDRARR